MATFIYAPGIQVHIESDTHGIIDVSEDLTQWQLIRNVNAVSTFNFTLQNTQRKYDQVFKPSDRITVQMKRITWVRVFTGTLNTVPIFSAWPRALPMSASCTLKKLQFWPWDPTTNAAVNLINHYYGNSQQLTVNAGSEGLRQLATDALVQVTGWDQKAIHIGQVPDEWFKFANQTETEIQDAINMQSVLGSQAFINGQVVTGSNLNFPTGIYGDNNLHITPNQVGIIETIFALTMTCTAIAPADRLAAATIAIMTAIAESTLTNIPPGQGDRDSVGVFQQRPSQGWGTEAQCADIQYATNTFLSRLVKVQGWQSMPPSLAAQTVQNSVAQDGSNYAKWLSTAKAIIQTCNQAYDQATSKANPGGISSVQTTNPTVSTGSALASNAYNLVQSHKTNPIKYVGDPTYADNPDNTPVGSVTALDCSSLIDWVYFAATGNHLNKGRSNAESIFNQCKAANTLITVDQARYIQGAVLFVSNGTPGSNNQPEHVAISLGNNTDVAAKDEKQGIKIESIDSGGGFNWAGLLPRIDYTSSATTQAVADQLKVILNSANTQVSPGTFSDNPTASATSNIFSQLVTALASPPVASGNIFGGARELINNTPFLPWLKALVNSSMRAFCSAPNGDFIAWFPDYFGVWGTAASMNIEPIELQEFTVDWSDQQMVTHEFVIGSANPLFDPVSGGISNGSDASYQGINAMQTTQGVVTMDFPQIFQAIYNTPATQAFVDNYLKRFGARPNVDQIPNIFKGQAEFYMALWNFMLYWSAQFNTEIPLTFMPELFPGMLLKIPKYDFQCYVQSVTHSGSYGDGGRFMTSASVIAPARTSSKTDLFGLLPLAGPAGSS